MTEPDRDSGSWPRLLSETDFALIDALQNDVRAPWSSIARSVGVSPGTARRRWQRLFDSGAVWTSVHPGPGSEHVLAHVEVACVNRDIELLCRDLCRQPRMLNLAQVTGDFNITSTVCAASLVEVRQLLNDVIGVAAGVQQIRASILTQTFRTGSDWTIGALARSQTVGRGLSRRSPTSMHDPRLLTVLGALEKDPRAPASEIAQALGCSVAHARRFVLDTARKETITQRVEFASASAGWTHTLILQLTADPQDHAEAVRRISAMPGTRMCSASTGSSSNIYVVTWLRSLGEATEVERQLTGSARVQVTNRSIVIKYYKRAGWLFDDNDRRSEFVSWNSGQHASAPLEPISASG